MKNSWETAASWQKETLWVFFNALLSVRLYFTPKLNGPLARTTFSSYVLRPQRIHLNTLIYPPGNNARLAEIRSKSWSRPAQALDLIRDGRADLSKVQRKHWPPRWPLFHCSHFITLGCRRLLKPSTHCPKKVPWKNLHTKMVLKTKMWKWFSSIISPNYRHLLFFIFYTATEKLGCCSWNSPSYWF